MKNVLWFEEVDKKSIPDVGGKGANLGEMTKAGFPVPPGFITTSGAYFSFIKYNKIHEFIREQTAGLNVRDNDALTKTSEAIKTKILGGEIQTDLRNDIMSAYREMCKGEEKFVAVRSSATAEDLPEASFAGQQSTFLNVKGEGDVVQAVKECWASLIEPRAIFYRAENNFDHLKVGLAAVVQEMIQSEVAGVMFTVDPVTGDRDRIAIEAAYGLGEIVVSGSVTPDRYSVSKSAGIIVDKSVVRPDWMIRKAGEHNIHADIGEEMGEKQKLPDELVVELAEIGSRIEEHYKFPQDIEWAFADGTLYIVQSRPITTLKTTQKEKEEEKEAVGVDIEEANVLVRGFGASPGVGKGNVSIIADIAEIGKMKDGGVLVTKMTTPDYVVAMRKASAIVTDAGGMTCHAAIVSREMGIPCIVGTKDATEVLKEGEFITVDATHGMVYKGDVVLRKGEEKAEAPVAAVSAPITGTKIYVNLAEVELAEKIAKMPCDGVGLLRAEFMVAGIGEHPRKMIEEGRGKEFTDKLANGLRTFASAFYPRPVVYRATDFKTNEYRNLKGGEKYEGEEANPMIGYRGCARYIAEPDLFKLELAAIKKVREEFGLRNLWLMIPFIRRVGEIRAIRDMLREMKIHRTRDFKLWIMVEVPSTVFLIDEFCKEGIDGVSIGSNDLTQLILGIDRDNEKMATAFDERSPAVMKAIEEVVRICNKNGVTCSICGQAPSVYPEFAEKMIEFGITSMSVNPDAIEQTRRSVASAEIKVMLKKLSRLEEMEREHQKK